ncbi:MAG: hypothetical protein AMXMBFR8_26810 [Nevskiales bacterium]
MPASQDPVRHLLGQVRAHFEARYRERLKGEPKSGRALRLRAWRERREPFLASRQFEYVLEALDGTAGAVEKAAALVDYLARVSDCRQAGLLRSDPKAVSTARDRMEAARKQALVHLIAAADLLGPNYQPRLAEMAEQVARDPWPTLYMPLWAEWVDPDAVGQRGRAREPQGGWRGLLVRDLGRMVPKSTQDRLATITRLIELSGDPGISQESVRPMLKSRKARRK